MIVRRAFVKSKLGVRCFMKNFDFDSFKEVNASNCIKDGTFDYQDYLEIEKDIEDKDGSEADDLDYSDDSLRVFENKTLNSLING
jgi:hypothetical protein